MARKGGQDRGLFERPKGSGVWWIDYVGPDRREHVERGGTKTNARALLARRKTEVADGAWQPPYGHGVHAANRSRQPASSAPLALGTFARSWLRERAPNLTLAVREDYERLLRFHLFSDQLAHKAIAEIHDGDIAGLITRLSEKRTRGGRSLSPRRINMVIARLRTMFATARRRKLIAEDPMPYVPNLREPKPEVEPFDLGEARRLIEAARGWTRAFLTVLLFTGMRPNEVLALPWDACDFEHDVIRVRRTVNRRHGFGLPKTPGSEREVEMGGVVRAALMEQRARSQLRGELVFPSETGTAIDLANFRRRSWPGILRRARVRARPIYQCRHTFARLALEQGDTPQHVAAMLGHTTLEMLFRVYSRWMERPESRALARLDAAFRAEAGRDSGQDSGLKSTQFE